MLDKICDTKSCTGCMSCMNICSKNAIKFELNKKGFWYPQILINCIECGKCVKTCPQNNFTPTVRNQDVYAMWNKEQDIRRASTSGGIFSTIAEYVLNKQGIVFGAMFNEQFKVVHNYITNMDKLYKLRGSKYVQSYIGNSYLEAEQFLNGGKLVLFSGTPCQIHGLYNYLGRNYDNLITTDIICHGVPSPKVFESYIRYMELSYSSKVKNIYFRYKKPSWTTFSMKIEFLDGEEYVSDTNTDPYIVGFLDDIFTRECCYNCSYTSENRIGDITMADFWGYISEKKVYRNTEEGISLVLVNSNIGKNIINIIKDKLTIVSKTLDEAKNGNRCLSSPYTKNPISDLFWIDYQKNNEFSILAKKYFVSNKISIKRRLSLFINDNAYIVPTKVRIIAYKFKGVLKKH